MKKLVNYGFVISFIWVGFVLSISFMEAWVKFRADSLDLPTALDVGRHVFGALNNVERLFSVFLMVVVFYQFTDKVVVGLGILIFTIVVAQSGYLLPELNEHAQLIMQGMQPQKSAVHMTYVVMEVLKVVSLFVLGMRQVKLFKMN